MVRFHCRRSCSKLNFVMFSTDTSGACSTHLVDEIYCNESGVFHFPFQSTGPNGPTNEADNWDCTVCTGVPCSTALIGPVSCKQEYVVYTMYCNHYDNLKHTGEPPAYWVDVSNLGDGDYYLRIRTDPNGDNADCNTPGGRRIGRNIPFSVPCDPPYSV